MILRLSLDLPEDLSYIRTTRLLSRTLLEDIKVVKADMDDVEMIVGELCSNVVLHAHSKEKHFNVLLEYFEPRIIITVKDKGEGFSQEDVSPAGTVHAEGTAAERYGGWGLSLVEGLSDNLKFTATVPHGTTVRVEKSLHYETQGDADEATERDTGSGVAVTGSTE